MRKHILFDFDGTLVDSKVVFVIAYNQLAQRHRFQQITESNLAQLKNLSLVNRLRFLKVPLYRVPFLTKEFLTLYEAGISSLTLIAGMREVLERLAEQGFGIGIVSSNAT